jgi:AraC-like DNA-binding protein
MQFTLSEFLRKENESFVIKRSTIYHALNEFHMHPEMELLHITEGTGTLVIGEKAIAVNGGELLLIGCNVPHMFRFEREKYENPIMKHGKMAAPLNLLTLHFDPLLIADDFINLPENGLIKNLLRDARKVFIVKGTAKKGTIELMENIQIAPVHEKLILLLQLLNYVAGSDDRDYLTDTPERADFNKEDETRLTKIFLITMNRFNTRIKLKEVAEAVYMVPNAFCNYFKQKTNKTYFQFLLEVRVNYACKLLKETNYSVVMICYDSGFTNLSNFNRHFKLITGKTPFEYRNVNRKSRF